MIIYKATNLITGKSYIGKTFNPLEKRINEHCRDKRNAYFHNAIRKHGRENFKWTILKECNNVLLLNILETFMIMVHHTFVDEGGYNLTYGGDGIPKGYKHTDEAKQNMSKSHTGDNHWLGKHHTEETKQRMVDAQKGEKNHMCGKHHTEETKQRIKNTKRFYSILKSLDSM